jgi:hypothetical protein
MAKNKLQSIHKESHIIGQIIIVLSLSFLGGIIGLCLSSAITGALIGLAIGLFCVYIQTRRQYACPECGIAFDLIKVDNENRFEEWICPACQCRLIVEFN